MRNSHNTIPFEDVRELELHSTVADERVDLTVMVTVLVENEPRSWQVNEMTDIEFVPVTKVGSILAGEGAAFPVNGKMVAIFFDGETYHAINDFCPHMGASLAEGHFEEGVVVCPWHAWGFKVCDGTWCENPAIKTDAYDLRVVGDEIQVAVPPDEDTDITDTDEPDA